MQNKFLWQDLFNNDFVFAVHMYTVFLCRNKYHWQTLIYLCYVNCILKCAQYHDTTCVLTSQNI